MRFGGIYDGSIDDHARLVHHGQLASGTVAGIVAQHRFALQRSRHQQMPQVVGKQLDGVLPGILRQVGTDFPLNGGRDQPVVGITHRCRHIRKSGALIIGNNLREQSVEDQIPIHLHSDFQMLLRFAPVHGQHPVRRHGFQLIAVVKVHLIGGIAVAVLLGADLAVLHRQRADIPTVGSIVGEILCQNV